MNKDFHWLQDSKSVSPVSFHLRYTQSQIVILESQAERKAQVSNLQVSRKGHIYLLSIWCHSIEEKGVMQGAIPNCFKPIESPGKKYSKNSIVKSSSASLSLVSVKHLFLDIIHYDSQWLR